MSNIETLTEGIVNRDMKKEGSALLSKWGKTGLLEGLQNEQERSTMARLLENQAKELLRESSSMGGSDVEGFAAVAFPIVRRVFAGLIANQLVSVQPMSLPSGLIFFLDFVYSPNLGESNSQTSRMGNNSDQSIYGTFDKGSEVIDGVSLVGATNLEDSSGPGRSGMVGYAYSSPTGSNSGISASTATDAQCKSTFTLDGAVTEANKKLLRYDADLLSSTNSSLGIIVVDIEQDKHSNADFDNLSAFEFEELTQEALNTGTDVMDLLNTISGMTLADGEIDHIKQIRRLTQKIDSASEAATTDVAIRYVFSVEIAGVSVFANGSTGNCGAMVAGTTAAPKLVFPLKDTVGVKTSGGGALDSYTMLLEGSSDIPEIDIKVDSTAITAQTKKLKAKWTPELGQDLNAYHNLDAEVELTSILSEQIALEIDREILADLVNGATAATYYWSRSPGLFVNKVTGGEIGQTSAAPDFTGTVSEWYETLIETINDVSAQIHRKTLRGGANFVIVSPEVANILEFTSGFRANVTADADKGDIGAVKVGSLSRKFDVIVDPYFPRNVVLVGRKGNSFLESGYVYAPYVPLQTTPTIFGPEDFVPRKGVMTRYAKKMVRPDMYGLVIVRGLLGEAGATS